MTNEPRFLLTLVDQSRGKQATVAADDMTVVLDKIHTERLAEILRLDERLAEAA